MGSFKKCARSEREEGGTPKGYENVQGGRVGRGKVYARYK